MEAVFYNELDLLLAGHIQISIGKEHLHSKYADALIRTDILKISGRKSIFGTHEKLTTIAPG